MRDGDLVHQWGSTGLRRARQHAWTRVLDRDAVRVCCRVLRSWRGAVHTLPLGLLLSRAGAGAVSLPPGRRGDLIARKLCAFGLRVRAGL